MKIGHQMLKESKGLTDWVNSQRKLYNGLPCELQNILSADVTEAYRNKCEFTIGNICYIVMLLKRHSDFVKFSLYWIINNFSVINFWFFK